MNGYHSSGYHPRIMRRAAFAVCLSLLVAGCAASDSILTPAGPRASEIAHLAWLLFGLGGAVFVIVMIAIGLAIGGSPRIRRGLAGERAVVTGGIVFPAVTLTALLGYGLWMLRAELRPGDGAPLHVEVVGEQWWWRVGYRGSGGPQIASANEIAVPVGREVTFTLTSADVIHSFWVPSLGGKVDMIPGRTTRLALTADREGVYRGQCAEYCGGPHALMAVRVIAMPGAEFERWLAREAEPARAPSGEIETRGRALLEAAGCGACHTVRGTAANGRLGPDLTHIGSRRSVGIDTLPLTQAHLVRFIGDGQHIKPGNLMPPFRALTGAERDAIAAYLVSLR